MKGREGSSISLGVEGTGKATLRVRQGVVHLHTPAMHNPSTRLCTSLRATRLAHVLDCQCLSQFCVLKNEGSFCPRHER